MLGIKKLDIYILRTFFPLFVAAFFICLFVFMMQTTWRYIDELVGKGLSLDVLGQFFWYMGITMVPMSLPLAILLASLITFGNMGEDLELLSMKAAGVSLIRIMRPIMIVVFGLTGASFYFQNVTAPEAQINMRTLLLSMKQQQPAVEIPEGVFYNAIPNLNLYVQRKNVETGMLYQTIIYKTDQGFDRAQIVLADSGRLEMTADKLNLVLDLWNGEQFENLQAQQMSALGTANVPYDRETFAYKRFIIDFDANFALMDKNMLRDMPQVKNMRQIEASVDSMEQELDSIGRNYYRQSLIRHYTSTTLTPRDSARLAALKALPFDTLLAQTPPERLHFALQNSLNRVRSANSELEWKSTIAADGDSLIRRHWVEWHQKMSLSLSCLIFFFIGAPLGAIIRKGGLGLPAVISVLVFIFYYIINTSGMKLARDGTWNMVFGMWISTMVLTPLGAFLTYKANRDSMLFNAELYLGIVRRLLGLRTSRHYFRKEVIIDDPDYDRLADELDALRDDCRDYAERARLLTAPSYLRIFFRPRPDHRVEEINERMEAIIESLTNSRSPQVLGLISHLPVIYTRAHTSPFTSRWANVAAGIVFPVGIVLWFRIWRFRLRLQKDMKVIVRTADNLLAAFRGAALQEEEPAPAPSPRRRRLRRRAVIVALAVAALIAGLVVGSRSVRRHKAARPATEQTTKDAGNDAPTPGDVKQMFQPAEKSLPTRPQ